MMTTEKQLELFKKQFPQEKIISVQERSGQDHFVLEINHIWICKSAKKEDEIYKLEREVRLLNLLKNRITTVAIPSPVHYEENFLVYKKIAGSPLIVYTINTMGQKPRVQLFDTIAKFIYELHHALTEDEIKSLNLQPSDWPWSLEKLEAQRSLIENNEKKIEVFDYVMNNCKDLFVNHTKKLSLIHDDLQLKNFIINPITYKLNGVIDFADIAFDDFLLDLKIRRDMPMQMSEFIAFLYKQYAKEHYSIDPLYGYFFMTEFSRYFQTLEEQGQEQAEVVFNEILQMMHTIAQYFDADKKQKTAMKTA